MLMLMSFSFRHRTNLAGGRKKKFLKNQNKDVAHVDMLRVAIEKIFFFSSDEQIGYWNAIGMVNTKT